MPSRAERRFLDAVGAALLRIGVRRDALVVVALSGGPDSVAMLRAMLAMGGRLGYRVMAAHLNATKSSFAGYAAGWASSLPSNARTGFEPICPIWRNTRVRRGTHF
jgi:tRNA(Ile)-lysidine synthase TilS/MesJ